MRPSRAFTFLELMLVIALIAILFIGTAPLISASGRERRLRAAAEDIEQVVRTERASAQASGDRRVLSIRPSGFYVAGPKSTLVISTPKGLGLRVRLPGETWQKPDGQEWEFSPIGMVSPYSVRLQDGESWIEVDFDLLTGRRAEERYAF